MTLLSEKIQKILSSCKQEQIWKKIEPLDRLQQLKIFQQLRSIRKKTPSLFFSPPLLSPLSQIESGENPHYISLGRAILEKGRAAALIFAGGLGSRTKSSLPKAIITLPNGKTLLSLFCEKLRSYQKKYQSSFPLLIMVSTATGERISSYLKTHNYFGLPPENVEIFYQENYPFSSLTGEWIIEKESIVELPNGNGDLFSALRDSYFFQSGCYERVSYLHLSNVDNLFSDPLSPSLMGYAQQKEADLTFQVYPRESLQEEVGLIVGVPPKVRIREYLDSSQEPILGYGNIGHYCFAMNSLEKIVRNKKELPFHWVKKEWQGIEGYKAEKFIFDIFPHLERIFPLSFPKRSSFYPLKKEKDFKDLPLQEMV